MQKKGKRGPIRFVKAALFVLFNFKRAEKNWSNLQQKSEIVNKQELRLVKMKKYPKVMFIIPKENVCSAAFSKNVLKYSRHAIFYLN